MQTHSNPSKRVLALGTIAVLLDIDPSNIKRSIAHLRKHHPDVPFPAPVRSLKYFDEYDADEVIAWYDKVSPNPVRKFNQMAQRFIRGEFDRSELQRQYKMKRIASKHCRKAA
jgi:hypothetical protein